MPEGGVLQPGLESPNPGRSARLVARNFEAGSLHRAIFGVGQTYILVSSGRVTGVRNGQTGAV